jgi:tRNA 2-thiouridine synthesizing protein E
MTSASNDDLDALLDTYGFLADPQRWNVAVAEEIATKLGIGPLEADHWRVLEHLREAFLLQRELPLGRHLCRQFDLDRDCIAKLFGGLVEAWKVAGLPDPGEEARVYMEDMEQNDSINPPPSAVPKAV